MDAQQVKQRFGIIGNSPLLNRALEVAVQVAPTDISVLVTGESGTGKEVIPQVIHNLSSRKHGPYIAVNCGAIPEGTIDSELFGHEKGSFTGAHESRKGYFEVANGGTIFLDEVAELPLQTQVRLLRVLETGEFIKVGSSKVIKTDVRIVAATNVNMDEAIKKGKFREDLLYRLSTVPIQLPPLRQRKEDIHLLFRKFASDFAEKYRMPAVKLSDDAAHVLTNYRWPGNIRQLKNIAEQVSVIENNRDISADSFRSYLPADRDKQLPMVISDDKSSDFSERELLYKVLFDMKKDINDMKKLILEILQNNGEIDFQDRTAIIKKLNQDIVTPTTISEVGKDVHIQSEAPETPVVNYDSNIHEIEVEESLSLEEREKELIKKALEKYKGKRKYAAKELGISERTLYRKIKSYNI